MFGGDDSTRVNPTTSFPYRAVVYIETDGGWRTSASVWKMKTIGRSNRCVHRLRGPVTRTLRAGNYRLSVEARGQQASASFTVAAGATVYLTRQLASP